MKKICAIILSIGICLFLLTDKPCSAEVSLGLSAWYAEWKFLNDDSSMDMKPGLLIGPSLSTRLDDSWSIAGVFLYGRFNNEGGQDSGPDYIDRFDSDLSLNYNINRYFKIFAGGKFMGYLWDEGGGQGKHWSAGPGIGIGTTIPLINDFYLLFNVSGTYSWGQNNNVSSSDTGLTETGVNASMSIAYYISSASTSISLGFRDQFFKCDYKEESEQAQDESFNFYGITLSAVFTF